MTPKVEGGESTVLSTDKKNKSGMAAPVATATLNGQSAQQVIANAGTTIKSNEKKIDGQGSKIAGEGEPLKSDVQQSAEQALKKGGLSSIATGNVGNAAFNLIDGPAQLLEQGTNALLGSMAQDTAKSLGFPPAPPPPPPPPTPVQSKWGMGPTAPITPPSSPGGGQDPAAKK